MGWQDAYSLHPEGACLELLDDLGGDACHDGIGRNIFGDNSSGSYDGIVAYGG